MSEDHRKYIRLYLNCMVFIELEASPKPGEDPGEIVMCKTLDVSYGGLKVSLSRELQQGAILPIGVELPAVDQTLQLVGEVKWCRPNGDAETGWAAGLELFNSEDTDISAWRDLLQHV